jgi:MFS transporter, DHA3 family, macrolide efflux protein
MFEDEQKNLPQGFGTFLVLWLTQSLSVIGSSVSFFALTIWIAQVLYPRPEQQPQLALALSGVTVFFAIPTVFGAPIAGAWADRHDRKTIMVAANFANAVMTALLLAALVSGFLSIWLILIFYTLTAVASAFHVAAFDSSYVMVVPPAQLSRANGMMQTSQSLSSIIAPGIAAALIALPALGRQNLLPPGVNQFFAAMPDGTALTLALDAATFSIAAIVLFFLNIPSPKRPDRDANGKLEKSLWADIRVGVSYIRQRPPLIWLLATFTVFTFCASARPLLATRRRWHFWVRLRTWAALSAAL